jgi:hypothetical protein
MARSNAVSSSRSAPAQKQSERSNNLPVFTCRHRALKAAVWRNESEENGPFFNTTVGRSYKDDKDEWQEAASFGYDDVLIIAELLRTCHGFISRELAKLAEQARE